MSTPFLLSDQFGYIDGDGAVHYRGYRSYGVTLDRAGFSNYPQIPEPVVIQNRDGSYAATLETRGYPIYLSGRLFTVDTAGTRLAEWTADGDVAWSADVPTPIHVVDADASAVALGLVAGGIVMLDRSGHTLPVTGLPSDLDGPVLGVALSAASDRVAALIGSQPTSLVLLGRSGDQYATVARRLLDFDLGPAPLVGFTPDGRALYYQGDRGVVVLDLADGAQYEVQLRSAARQLAPVTDELRAIVALGDEPDPARSFRKAAELVVASDDGTIVVRQEFAADLVALATDTNTMMLSIDDRILGFTVAVR